MCGLFISIYFYIFVSPSLELSTNLCFLFSESFCIKDDPKCLSDSCQKDSECSAAAENVTCRCLELLGDPSAEDCARADDPCSSSPCFHNATCLSAAGNLSFTCNCPVGYNGTTCETTTSRCGSHACRHGGTCRDEPGGLICSCPEGYTGTHCETDINECFPNPCLNGAVCRDRIDGYSCYCVPGYQGKHCDLEVNECVSEPCLNNATCLDLIGKYGCVCRPEYTGKRLWYIIDLHRCKHALLQSLLEDISNFRGTKSRPWNSDDLNPALLSTGVEDPCEVNVLFSVPTVRY